MINKIKKFIQKSKVLNIRKWSISTQMFSIFALLFALYYVLQTLIANVVFSNYFTQKQISAYKNQITEMKKNLESPDDFYDFAIDFYVNSKVYSVILDENFNMLSTSDYDYTIKINDISYKLPATLNHYVEKDLVHIYYKKIENENVVCRVENKTTNNTQYISSCGDSYLEEEGYIKSIVKPNNLNDYFKTDANVITEYDLIKSNRVEYLDYFSKNNIKIYHNDFSNALKTNLVFISKISFDNTDYYILNITSIPLVSNILKIVLTYNTYIFLFIIVVISIVYIYLTKLISRPILELSEVALDISNMNFRQRISRKTNKETQILADSINKVSNNLSKTIQSLKDKNEKIKAETELKNQIVSSLSHEMKTPLFIMQATISAILDGLFDEEMTQEELTNVLNEINKTSKMIEQLVQVYKKDESSEELHLELFSLNDLVHKIVKDFSQNLKSSNIKLVITESNQFNVLTDKNQLSTVLTNLILNAIKYTPDNNKIDIKLNETSKFIVINIINYGVTISQKDLTKIFEPFYRVDKSGKKGIKTEGNGLGLFIVKQILNRLKIKYEATSEDNYVCFTLYYNKSTHLTNKVDD